MSVSLLHWIFQIVGCHWAFHLLEFAIITGPTHMHFINRDTYRNRVDQVIGLKTVILDLRKLVYIDCSAIMTLQVGEFFGGEG